MCIWHLTTAFMHKLEPKIPSFSFLAFFRKKEKIREIELSETKKPEPRHISQTQKSKKMVGQNTFPIIFLSIDNTWVPF